MKTVIIHGQSHKGSTYNIARQLAEKIGGDISEFFLPRDFDEFCLGCTTCFVKGKEHCPHFEKLHPITEELNSADVIILASPVYGYHATGAMKAFLDHHCYMWMAHRPEEGMFKKQAVCIATAAGAGTKSTIKDMKDSLYFWGVPRIYKLGLAVAAVDWDGVSQKKKAKIENETSKLSDKIRKNNGNVKPGLKLKITFAIMRLVQIHGWNPLDMEYWRDKGWTENKRPWKN